MWQIHFVLCFGNGMGTYCDQVVSSDALETKMKPNCEQIDAQRSAIIKFYGYYMKSQMKVCFGNISPFILLVSLIWHQWIWRVQQEKLDGDTSDTKVFIVSNPCEEIIPCVLCSWIVFVGDLIPGYLMRWN